MLPNEVDSECTSTGCFTLMNSKHYLFLSAEIITKRLIVKKSRITLIIQQLNFFKLYIAFACFGTSYVFEVMFFLCALLRIDLIVHYKGEKETNSGTEMVFLSVY